MDYFFNKSNTKINMTIIGKTEAYQVMNKKYRDKFFLQID